MKREFLEGLNIDKEVIDKILDENSRDIGREKQKADQAKEDLAAVQEQLTARDKDIEELKKTSGDAEGIRKQLEELQSRYTKETEEYKTQLADRDYSDAMSRAVSEKGIKFSSKAAEKAYLADLKAKNLTLKDGVLDGFEDWHKAQVEADPTAFQSGKPAPVFTKPVGTGGAPAREGIGALYAKQFNAQYAAKANTAQTTSKE